VVFAVPPVASVSSDLSASAVMKPFGGLVHARRHTVHWPIVGWLCVGSVPAAFSGVLLLRLFGPDAAVQRIIQYALAVALVLAAVGLVAKTYVGRAGAPGERQPVQVRPVRTALLGAAGGLIVGLTSVGSGSLIIVVLLLLYPALRANDLVGTDLVQAVPLVAAAALGHALFGDLRLDIAGAVVLGSIPGVLLGARVSARAPAGVVRPILVVVLLASALKLFALPNLAVGLAALGAAVLATADGVRRYLRNRSRAAVLPEPSPTP
jgi:uncharacterized membrane protein YfcA